MGSFTDKLNQLENEIKVLKTQDDSGQRSPEWFEQRKGRFTGSKISDLMTCGRSTAKKGWDAPEKIFDLGKGAISYIYSRAKELQRDKVISSAETYQMKFGTKSEPIVRELYLSENIDLRFEEIGFLEFIKDVAGASPDGRIISDKETYGLEIKCPTTWENFYSRVETEMNHSHTDFWQLQAEMLALDIDKMIYIVAEPPTNIFEPEFEFYSKRIVYASEVHQNAIIKRCEFGRKIINEYLKTGTNFDKCIELATKF